MDIQPLDILKWVGVVFVAGFIGYFGRYLSMLIIVRMRKRKLQQTPGTVSASEQTLIEETRLKLEKKKAKAEAKKAKKKRKK